MFLLASNRLTLFSRKFAALLILYLLLLILNREFNFSCRSKVVRALKIKSTWEGGCGNIDYEIHTTDNSDAVFSNSSINKKKISQFNIEKQLYKHMKKDRYLSKTNKFNRVEAEEKLKNELVKVRLNVVYDSSFAEEFPQTQKLENYVRNVILSAQIVLNQEEISKHMKINLVVVNLKKSTQSFDEHMQSLDILYSFGRGPDIGYPEADLNVLITFRNFWMFHGRRSRSFFETANYDLLERVGTSDQGKNFERDANIRGKILGQATTDTFCKNQLPSELKILIFTAPSICSGPILAHELAHSFGIEHDGIGRSRDCTAPQHIMYPEIGKGRLRWSQCTVRNLIENFIERIDCLFDPTRVSKSVPIKPLFDFSQSTNLSLPGKQMSIDAQCAQALGSEIATSSLNAFGRNGDSVYETCQSLVCTVGGFMEVDIGPAPAGSQCTSNGGAYCSQGSCIKP